MGLKSLNPINVLKNVMGLMDLNGSLGLIWIGKNLD